MAGSDYRARRLLYRYRRSVLRDKRVWGSKSVDEVDEQREEKQQDDEIITIEVGPRL